jgi:methionyl-tRNA formyltransferase
MKIVYFGNNLFSSCLKYLLAQGHEILRVYKNNSARNSSIIDSVCADNCIPLHSHKPSESELNQLITLGAEMFIVAEYSYLLPVTKVKYAINIHPTLLPEGRGPTPLPFLITQPKFSGITLHKIVVTICQ